MIATHHKKCSFLRAVLGPVIVFGTVIALAGCRDRTASGPEGTSVLTRQISIDGKSRQYYVYLPPGYTAERAWPILLFLHGRGNGGNVRSMAVDLGAAVRKSPGLYPCIIVLPECPLLDMWIGPMIRYAVTAMDRAALEFHGDTARLYVSGISMGGYGAFICAVDYPGKFAALAPLCGGVIPPFRFSQAVYRRMSASCREVLAAKDPYARLADFVGKTPVWLFHSADDPVIPATESRNIAAALKAAGDSVRFTEYKNLGHEIGYATYSDPQLADWLLKQRLPCP